MEKKIYAFCVFIFAFVFYCYYSLIYTDINPDIVTAITKLSISSILIISCSIFHYDTSKSREMLSVLNKYLTVIVILSLAQVVILHVQSGWNFIFASNSYDASKLFTNNHSYFGGDDKNMFGAKVALFGLLQYVSSSILKKKNTNRMLALSFLSGALSMSRTPVAFLLAAFIIYKFAIKKGFALKIITVVIFGFFLAAASPYIIEYLRIDSVISGQRSDGMAIRILYWVAVLSNIDVIGMMGNGILSARQFLTEYSVYYNGEPNVHNLYLNTFLDLGFIGLFLYSGFFASLYILMRSMNKRIALVTISCAFIMSCTLYTAYDIEMWCFLSSSLYITRMSKYI